MNKNIELRIYELLGIKIFRKMAFCLYKILGFPFTIFMSKENRKNFYNAPNNYNMKKGHGIKDLKDFKKWLLFNAGIHVYGLFSCTFTLMMGSILVSTIIAAVINAYCIMLQRYNHIRINQTIEKWKLREKKQKDAILKEMEQENVISNNFVHKIVDKRDKEVTITFEEFLQKATLSQLKDYKEILQYYNYVKQVDESTQIDSEISLEKRKYLRIENR